MNHLDQFNIRPLSPINEKQLLFCCKCEDETIFAVLNLLNSTHCFRCSNCSAFYNCQKCVELDHLRNENDFAFLCSAIKTTQLIAIKKRTAKTTIPAIKPASVVEREE